jgi:hypothetical protein
MITTNIFKQRAADIHGNKYDYDKSIYYKYHEKLIISCREHGDFPQSPAKHLTGRGCPKCAIYLNHEKLKTKWSEAEDNFLIENYEKYGPNFCVEHINFKYSSVYKRANKLGLTKKIKKKTSYKNENISHRIWNSLINGATRRRLAVSISKNDVWELFLKQDKKCALSGREIYLHKDSDTITASVDRINSNVGYTMDNIQIVHKDINKAKQNMTDHDFYILCKDVHSNLKNKQNNEKH